MATSSPKTSLRFQIKCYIALKEIIAERRFDFVGVKCHYDLSEYYVTQCLAAALCNDPYDWDGPKEPVVFSCEADSDGALTMQVLKLVSGQPALFFDFRHYDAAERRVRLLQLRRHGHLVRRAERRPGGEPEVDSPLPDHPQVRREGLPRPVRRQGGRDDPRATQPGHRPVQVHPLPRARYAASPKPSCRRPARSGPTPSSRVQMDPMALVERYDSHHIHGVSGDHIAELVKFCELKHIECEVIE